MNKKIEKDDMKAFLIEQPNAVTMSKHDLTTHQMRIMMRIMEYLQPRLERDKEAHEIDAKILEDRIVIIPTQQLLLSNTDKNHSIVRRAIKDMTKKNITIEICDENGVATEIYTNLIKEGIFKFRKSVVELEISKHLMPYFLSLAKGYTRFDVKVAFQSSSPKIMKMYQFISRFRDKKWVNVNIDTLRSFLAIENKYSEPNMIKRWVLEPVMKELKSRADVWFDIASRRMDPQNKRSMIGWKFNIYTKKTSKKKSSNALPEATQTATPINGPKPPNLEHLENKLMLNASQAKQIVAFFNKATAAKQKKLKTILQEIQWAIRDKKIHTSVGGYVTKTINETFKGDLKI